MVATRAFSYLFCAKRPLTIDELLHALSVETDDTELCEDALPDIPFILGASAGLVRVDMESRSASLVHHSLREYLEKRPNGLLPQPEFEMARTCLTYMAFDEFDSGPCADGESLDRRLQKNRFLDYACHHWASHFREHHDGGGN
jgi:hypothetical protein